MDKQELSRMLDELTELARQQGLSQEIDERLRRKKIIDEYNGRSSTPQQEPIFDAEAADARLSSLAAQYQQLMKNPTQNAGQMNAIETQIKNLDGQVQTHQAGQRTAVSQAAAPELDALGSDIDTLSSEMQRLSKEPSKNWSQIQAVDTELKARTQRAEQLERGESDITLKWSQ